MAYIDSKKIKLYPTAYRGKIEVNGDKKLYNPESILNTENNLNRVYKIFTTGGTLPSFQNDGFVISDNTNGIFNLSNNDLEFVIGGYYFKILKGSIQDDEVLSGNKIYAHIYTTDLIPETVDVDNTSYPATSLINITTKPDDPTNQVLDEDSSGTDKFKALQYNNEQHGIGCVWTGVTEYNLLILEKVGGNWRIPECSKIKFDVKDIRSADTSRNILNHFKMAGGRIDLEAENNPYIKIIEDDTNLRNTFEFSTQNKKLEVLLNKNTAGNYLTALKLNDYSGFEVATDKKIDLQATEGIGLHSDIIIKSGKTLEYEAQSEGNSNYKIKTLTAGVTTDQYERLTGLYGNNPVIFLGHNGDVVNKSAEGFTWGAAHLVGGCSVTDNSLFEKDLIVGGKLTVGELDEDNSKIYLGGDTTVNGALYNTAIKNQGTAETDSSVSVDKNGLFYKKSLKSSSIGAEDGTGATLTYMESYKQDVTGLVSDVRKTAKFTTGGTQGHFKVNDTDVKVYNMGTADSPTFNKVFSSALQVGSTSKGHVSTNSTSLSILSGSTLAVKAYNNSSSSTPVAGRVDLYLGDTLSIILDATNGTITASTFSATSDKRLKNHIMAFNPNKSVLDLPIYKFDFINGPKNQIGCLAQDLQEICPEIVNESEDGYLKIQESKIVYLLLDEVKKLKEKIDILENKRSDV